MLCANRGTDKRGNRVLIGITVLNLVLYGLIWLFYRGINKRRDRIWNGWTAKVWMVLLHSPDAPLTIE